jgi:uncharacterized protein (TIGR02757 family)
VEDLKKFLDKKVIEYNKPKFITHDPISIPHRFSKLQDIEIAGFFAATLAWGNRKSILNSCTRLLEFMDNSPYQFITQHDDNDLKKMMGFVHRTFNAMDLYYFISFLHMHYSVNVSLESAFTKTLVATDTSMENGLNGFYNYFFSLEYISERTRKHVAAPVKKSACKRLNMFLRWMVRKDNNKVDFGLWNGIQPHQLVIPLDVHVANVSYRLGLLDNANSNWNNAIILSTKLKQMDANDPTKYDYALFGLGVEEKFR